MSDRITVTGLQIHAHHGLLPAEAELGQRFVVDATLFLDLGPAGRSDDPSQTVSYVDVVETLTTLLTDQRFGLIEAAAEAAAHALFKLSGRIERVAVTLHKPTAPIAAIFGDVSVTIERLRPGRDP